MLNLLLLSIAYILLGIAFFVSDSTSVKSTDLLLLSASVANAIALNDITRLVLDRPGNIANKYKVLGIFFLVVISVVLAIDLARVFEGNVWSGFIIAVPVFVISAYPYFFVDQHSKGLRASMFYGSLVSIVVGIVPHALSSPGVIAVFEVAHKWLVATFESDGKFLMERYRAWAHLILVPCLYLVTDLVFALTLKLRRAQHTLELDIAVATTGIFTTLAGVAIACSKLAVVQLDLPKGTEGNTNEIVSRLSILIQGLSVSGTFEKGAAATLLVLGNHAYLAAHREGYLRWFHLVFRYLKSCCVCDATKSDSTIEERLSRYEENVNRLWNIAWPKWANRSREEDWYRQHCISPILGTAIAGAAPETIRIIDLGAGDGRAVNMLLEELQNRDVTVDSLLMIERYPKFVEAIRGKSALEFQQTIKECEVVPESLRNVSAWTNQIKSFPFPTVYLTQYVIQELPELRSFFTGLGNSMDSQDTCICVIPEPSFVNKLTSNGIVIIEEQGNDDTDWSWFGTYSTGRNTERILLPHFDREVDVIITAAENCHLKLLATIPVTAPDTNEARENLGESVYGETIINVASSRILIFRSAKYD